MYPNTTRKNNNLLLPSICLSNFTTMTPKSDPTIVQAYETKKFWIIYGSIPHMYQIYVKNWTTVHQEGHLIQITLLPLRASNGKPPWSHIMSSSGPTTQHGDTSICQE